MNSCKIDLCKLICARLDQRLNIGCGQDRDIRFRYFYTPSGQDLERGQPWPGRPRERRERRSLFSCRINKKQQYLDCTERRPSHRPGLTLQVYFLRVPEKWQSPGLVRLRKNSLRLAKVSGYDFSRAANSSKNDPAFRPCGESMIVVTYSFSTG